MPDQGLRSEVTIDPAIQAVEIKVTARVPQEDEALAMLGQTGEDQERLIEEYGPPDVGWDALTVRGPIDVRKWKVEFDDFPHEVVAERWQLPDGSDLVELSIKVRPGEAVEVTDDFGDFLAKHGLGVAGDQQTRTKGALAFFTAGRGFD